MGLKYYPLCGFDYGHIFMRGRHGRTHGFGEAEHFGSGQRVSNLTTKPEAPPASSELSNFSTS